MQRRSPGCAKIPGLCEDPRTTDLGIAVCVAIHRHRFVVDPQDVPEGARTLAARAEVLKGTFEATGLDQLLVRIVELKKVLWFESGRPELPLSTAAALLAIYTQAIYGWNPAVPGPRYPDVLDNWKVIPGGAPEGVPEWMLSTQAPAVFALMRNRQEHPIIRSQATWWFACNWWGVDPAISRKVLAETDVLEALLETISDLFPVPSAGRDDIALASADRHRVLSATTQTFVGLGSLFNLSSAVANLPTLPREYADACLKAGVPSLCARWLQSYMQLRPDEAACSELANACTILQHIAQPDGACAHQLLEVLADAGVPAELVHKCLVHAVDHGAEIHAMAASETRLQLKAANVMAHLFGRLEAESGDDAPSITVPNSVILDCVSLLRSMLDGSDNGNPVAQCDSLRAISISDANTPALVEGGILGCITLALTQGPDVVNQREGFHSSYNVPAAREACLALLLNLALSDKTTSAVLADAELKRAIEQALSDGANLTPKANKYIAEIKFQLSLAADSGLATERLKAAQAEASEDDRHVMLSYCWAQQEVVVKIRHALGDRGLKIWLDLEQMEGSTVDAMADAIDQSSFVCYGVSREYKESTNCKLEAMYAHQAGVSMVPMMLSDNYKANGWLGMLLGTRLWYGFYGLTVTDEGKFNAKIEELCREISKKATLNFKTAAKAVEAVSPKPTAAPAPPALGPADDATRQARGARAARAANLAPAPASAPAPAPNLAQIAAGVSSSSMSFAEVAAFFREERLYLEQKMEQQRRSMEAQWHNAEPQPLISDAQLEALQERLQTLHRNKLLDQVFVWGIEDTIADCIEVLPKADVTEHSLQQTQRMVLLSEKIPADEMLARQLARKFGKGGGM